MRIPLNATLGQHKQPTSPLKVLMYERTKCDMCEISVRHPPPPPPPPQKKEILMHPEEKGVNLGGGERYLIEENELQGCPRVFGNPFKDLLSYDHLLRKLRPTDNVSISN